MSLMFRMRAMASRKAWLKREESGGMHRYLRLEAYEKRRNRTETYTRYWELSE